MESELELHLGRATLGQSYTWAELPLGRATLGQSYTWAELHLGRLGIVFCVAGPGHVLSSVRLLSHLSLIVWTDSVMIGIGFKL